MTRIWTFTGHRPHLIKDYDKEKELLKGLLLLNSAVSDEFVTGGCPGFDTIALESLLELGVNLNNITIAVPFIGFEKYAGRQHEEENSRTREFNKSCGVKMIEVGGEGTFAVKCYRRNQYLVDQANAGIFTNWNGIPKGGTANTIKLAQKKQLPIFNIWET